MKSHSLSGKQNVITVANGIDISDDAVSSTIWTNNGDKLYNITKNIGIGVYNPTRQLGVQGSINYTGTLLKNNQDILSTKANTGHSHTWEGITNKPNTDVIQEGTINMYFTYDKVGSIGASCNLVASNVLYYTSNILQQQVNAISTGEIPTQGTESTSSQWSSNNQYIQYGDIRIYSNYISSNTSRFIIPDEIKFQSTNFSNYVDTTITNLQSQIKNLITGNLFSFDVNITNVNVDYEYNIDLSNIHNYYVLQNIYYNMSYIYISLFQNYVIKDKLLVVFFKDEKNNRLIGSEGICVYPASSTSYGYSLNPLTLNISSLKSFNTLTTLQFRMSLTKIYLRSTSGTFVGNLVISLI